MPEILRILHQALPETVLPVGVGLDETQSIESALVPIYIFDAESHAILAANAAARRLYGYGEEEFLRLSLYDIRPPEEAERTRRHLADGWPPGLRYSGVWRHRAKDGRVFSVNAMGLRIVRDGRPAILAIVSDLTQTMRLPLTPAQAGNALFPFAEHMDEVCWIRRLDDNRLVYINLAFERMFGLPREAAYADQDVVLSLVHDEDIDAVRRYAYRQANEPARLEYRIRRPDGALRWVASRSFTLEDAAGERMMAGFIEDITERKRTEVRRLKAVEAQRDALVREVHHRIKNSLQGVTGLLNQFAAAHPQLAPLLAEAAAQVQSLAAVHGLKGLSATGRVELCELMRTVVLNGQTQMQARIEADMPSDCHPGMAIAEKNAVPVALVLNEIVTNAVKHGEQGGRVGLSAAIDTAAGTAEIRVVNRGSLLRGAHKAANSGNGLKLIHMLLPSKGARFELREQDGVVVASLRLGGPVIEVSQ